MKTRRDALALIAVTASAALMRPKDAFAQAPADGLLIDGARVCRIQPRATEGPFYFDPRLVRRDIAEGLPGVPLGVRMQVVDAACRPVEGARVDIWHCDAVGRYSGYGGQGRGNEDLSGTTFLRGTQQADADGIASFSTIYPGWYPGRTPHIHFMIYLGGDEALTGQIFFPDETSAAIYARHPAYRGQAQDTRNADDFIARRSGETALATIADLRGSDAPMAAALVVAVDRG